MLSSLCVVFFFVVVFIFGIIFIFEVVLIFGLVLFFWNCLHFGVVLNLGVNLILSVHLHTIKELDSVHRKRMNYPCSDLIIRCASTLTTRGKLAHHRTYCPNIAKLSINFNYNIVDS